MYLDKETWWQQMNLDSTMNLESSLKSEEGVKDSKIHLLVVPKLLLVVIIKHLPIT